MSASQGPKRLPVSTLFRYGTRLDHHFDMTAKMPRHLLVHPCGRGIGAFRNSGNNAGNLSS